MASSKIMMSLAVIATAFFGCKARQFGESKSDISSEADHSKFYDANDPFYECYYDWEPGREDLLYLCTGEKKGAHYCLEKYSRRNNDWDWRFKAAHSMPPLRVNPLQTHDKAWAVFEKPDNADIDERILLTEVKEGAQISWYDLNDGSRVNVVGADGTFKRSFILDRKTGKGKYTVEFKEKGIFKRWKIEDEHTLTCVAPDPSRIGDRRPRTKTPTPGSEPPMTPTPGSEPPKSPTPG